MCWLPCKAASPVLTARWAAWGAAPTPRAPAATSAAKTPSTCWTPWVTTRVSTCRFCSVWRARCPPSWARWPRPAAFLTCTLRPRAWPSCANTSTPPKEPEHDRPPGPPGADHPRRGRLRRFLHPRAGPAAGELHRWHATGRTQSLQVRPAKDQPACAGPRVRAQGPPAGARRAGPVLHRHRAADPGDRTPASRRLAHHRRPCDAHGRDAEDPLGLCARPRPEPDRDLRTGLTRPARKDTTTMETRACKDARSWGRSPHSRP